MNRLQTQHQGRPSVETVNDDGKVVLESVLVDGRNRCEACKIASTDPTSCSSTLSTAYVSADRHHHHTIGGQRAMAALVLETNEPDDAAKCAQLSQERFAQARTILHYMLDLALGGAGPLGETYKKAWAQECSLVEREPARRSAAPPYRASRHCRRGGARPWSGRLAT
jgi:hypothetical protein